MLRYESLVVLAGKHLADVRPLILLQKIWRIFIIVRLGRCHKGANVFPQSSA